MFYYLYNKRLVKLQEKVVQSPESDNVAYVIAIKNSNEPNLAHVQFANFLWTTCNIVILNMRSETSDQYFCKV